MQDSKDMDVKLSDNPKPYFEKDFLADDIPRKINADLVEHILLEFPNANTFFEFGTGQGKNLDLLKKISAPRPVWAFGIDVNKTAVHAAIAKGRMAAVGDEELLHTLDNIFDVAFTCSVLDHIINIDGIIYDLKRIARYGVVLAETNDKRSAYYYKHNYQDYGFVKKEGYFYNSLIDGDGGTYEIFTWHKSKAYP